LKEIVEPEQWTKTFLQFRHPLEDEEIGKNLKEIVDQKRGEKYSLGKI
jgi:hypothetical protein